jgi:hypothetical protein
MASDEYFRELSYIVEKGAVNVVQDYFKLLDSVETLMSMSKMNVQQISEAAGISEWQLYRRKNKPELWTKDELIKLFSYLEVKPERRLAQQSFLVRALMAKWYHPFALKSSCLRIVAIRLVTHARWFQPTSIQLEKT